METFGDLVCVLCGAPWLPGIKNVCECGGFCTWGARQGAEPDSWIRQPEGGYVPRPPACEACRRNDHEHCTAGAGRRCGCFERQCDEAEKADRALHPGDYEEPG